MRPRLQMVNLAVIALIVCTVTRLVAHDGKEHLTINRCSGTTAAQLKNQVTVTGNVRDSEGAVVAAAKVSVKLVKCKCSDCSPPEPCKCCPNQFNVTTDNAGNFNFTVPHGTYTISVKLGPLRSEETLDVNEGTSTSTNLTVHF